MLNHSLHCSISSLGWRATLPVLKHLCRLFPSFFPPRGGNCASPEVDGGFDLLLVCDILVSGASLILLYSENCWWKLSALLQFLVRSFYHRNVLRSCGKIKTNAAESSEPVDWNWSYWTVLWDPSFPLISASEGGDALEHPGKVLKQLLRI